MPNKPEDANPNAILALLKELGLDAVSAEPVRNTSSGMVRLSVTVRPDAKDKAEYAHPVDIMGTNMPSTLNVVCLFGRMQPNDIVDKICRLEMNRMALVFLNGPLDLQGRRQISERFHKEMSGLNPFLLIDWVLLLYLALRQKTERMPAMLSCTLPYTSSFQPFVESGSVSDEMFIGRKRELNKILDPNGPVIVYGGRQLGNRPAGTGPEPGASSRQEGVRRACPGRLHGNPQRGRSDCFHRAGIGNGRAENSRRLQYAGALPEPAAGLHQRRMGQTAAAHRRVRQAVR